MARAFTPIENLFDSAKKAAAKLVAKSKTGPHAWLSFRLGNSRSPSVNNHSPSAPTYTTTSGVVDPPYSTNSEETEEEPQDRIKTLNNRLQFILAEQPTIPEVEISTLPQNITGNTHFYNTYGDRALYEVPLIELVHEVVFLRLLNKLPGLTIDTIKESVEAAVRIYPDITPIELFHRYGYKTYFTPTNSTGIPEPSPIPESFGNTFSPIQSPEQPQIRVFRNDERTENTRPEVVNISEDEGSVNLRNNEFREEGPVASGDNEVKEEGSVASRNSDIREKGSFDSSNNENRGERVNLEQSQNATPPPERQENQELNQGQFTPKLIVDQPAVPKRVTFTPEPLGNTMEGRGQSPGSDDQQTRLVEFETIYRTLIEQNIPSDIAALAASQVLSGTRSSHKATTPRTGCVIGFFAHKTITTPWYISLMVGVFPEILVCENGTKTGMNCYLQLWPELLSKFFFK